MIGWSGGLQNYKERPATTRTSRERRHSSFTQYCIWFFWTLNASCRPGEFVILNNEFSTSLIGVSLRLLPSYKYKLKRRIEAKVVEQKISRSDTLTVFATITLSSWQIIGNVALVNSSSPFRLPNSFDKSPPIRRLLVEEGWETS